MGFSETGRKHTLWSGPWHYCGICDRKTKIADMKWELGVLKCPRCVDGNGEPGLIGERDVRIAQVLSDGKEEYAPVEKLRNPDSEEVFEDFVL